MEKKAGIRKAINLLEKAGYVVIPPISGTCRECGQEFTVKRGKVGRPQTDFCSAEHRTAWHDRDAANRVRLMRKRRKAVNQGAKP